MGAVLTAMFLVVTGAILFKTAVDARSASLKTRETWDAAQDASTARKRAANERLMQEEDRRGGAFSPP